VAKIVVADQIVLECLYCGHKWEQVYYGGNFDMLKCPRCDDKNLRARRLSDTKIDTYGDKVGANNDGKGDGWNKW
jgi:transcription elongation factor Elf1